MWYSFGLSSVINVDGDYRYKVALKSPCARLEIALEASSTAVIVYIVLLAVVLGVDAETVYQPRLGAYIGR